MDKLLASFDKQIRAGQGKTVRKILESTPKKKIPRAQLAQWAWLAWRVGAPDLGIAWLNGIVRPKARSPVAATPRERAEYAACLTRLGALGEALDLLKTVSPKDVPQAILYQVFALVAQWRYGETIPRLERFLDVAPSDYDRQIAGVNLAAALIFEKDYDRAISLLEKLEKETAAANHQLLWGNVQELRSSVFVHMGKWKLALKECEGARAKLEKHGGVFALLIEKWTAVAELGRAPFAPASARALTQVKARAAALGHWESIRDCDRFESVILRDSDLLRKLYFGTPYDEFRARILSDFPARVDVTGDYERVLGEGTKGKGVSLDLGKWVGEMKPGRQNHRCLSILASDFYRPFRSAQLHALLFPGAFYNPHSSRHRTAEAMYRLKSWLKKELPGLSVSRGTHGYSLVAKVPVRLKVRAEVAQYRDPELERLREAYAGSPFSVSDTMDSLGMARRTASRQLTAWVTEGTLRRTGAGQGTRYSFTEAAAEEGSAEEVSSSGEAAVPKKVGAGR